MIEDIFRTPVFSVQLDLDNDRLYKDCLKIKRQYKGRLVSNRGGYQSGQLLGLEVDSFKELSTTNKDWDRIQNVNLRAPFIIAKSLAPKMIEQKQGKIVNISSVASEFALEDHVAYSVSKSGLNMMTKSMTVEWAKHNNIDLDGKTYIIQGYGNVGSHTALLLNRLGLICIGVADHTRCLKSTEGFNVYKLNK